MIKPQVFIATVDYADTTNMSYMFNGCSSLTKIRFACLIPQGR